MAGLLALLAFRGPLHRAAVVVADDPENPVVAIARKLGEFYQRAQPEKAYLHLDRPAYGTGETIWFSAYVVDALRHRPDSLSRILYVELLSPQRRLVARRTLRLDAGGRSAGDIALDDTLRAGTYLLRAYTNWMRNSTPELFFQRPLQVWPAAPNQPDAGAAPSGAAPKTRSAAAGAPASLATSAVDVQFFAEGGQLVAGLPAVVGFKAVAPNGLGVSVSGQLLDAQNKLITNLTSTHAGMGRVGFVPAAGQRYHARLRLPDGRSLDYTLPAVAASGYVLHVVEVSDAFLVEARYRGATGTTSATGAVAPGPVSLLAEGRGVVVGLAARPIGTEGEPVAWRVQKSRYPTGIVHFTLFDAQGAPQAERLAFVRSGPPALRVQLTPDRAAYAPHDPVRVRVQVLDAAGQPLPAPAHLSVAVAEAGAAALDPTAGTVAAHLLLTSELSGYVENPDYYLQSPTPEITRALDDLLLTQGWRRFVWKQVLTPDPPTVPARFPPERELALAGQVTGMGQRGIPNSQLTFIQTKPQRNVLTASTDADGRFRFVGFPGLDTTVVTLQARRTTGGSNVIIRPDLGAPPAAGAFRLPTLPVTANPALADYLRRSRQQQVQERQNDPEAAARTIVLADVAVTAKKQLVPANDPRRLFPGVTAGTVLDFASMPEAQGGIPIFSLLQGRVAGLTISGTPPNQTIQIRNQGTPLFILDGVRVDADVINSVQSSDVEAVEVFKGAEAAIFGGSGGAIAIYTKRGDRNYRGPASPGAPSPGGLLTVRLPGYYPAREFYQPRYGAPVLNAPATDPRRLTLYWNPQLTTNAQGQAEFTFFTADGSGNFQLTAEGISLDGEPSRGTATVYVAPK